MIDLNLSTRSTGALAQLGERVVCNHEVIGSIPIRSMVSSVQFSGQPRNPSLAISVRKTAFASPRALKLRAASINVCNGHGMQIGAGDDTDKSGARWTILTDD